MMELKLVIVKIPLKANGAIAAASSTLLTIYIMVVVGVIPSRYCWAF